MNSNINNYDLIMIILFIIIICAFGFYKYMHNEISYDDLDKQVDDILNKKDNINKQLIKQEIPKKLNVEDYYIPEFSVNSDSATALENEVKSRM